MSSNFSFKFSQKAFRSDRFSVSVNPKCITETLHTTFGLTEVGFGPAENTRVSQKLHFGHTDLHNSVGPKGAVQWPEAESVTPKF